MNLKERIKIKISNYYPNISIETIFMNMENSKTSLPDKFVLITKIRLKKIK